MMMMIIIIVINNNHKDPLGRGRRKVDICTEISCSFQDGIYALGKAHNYALHPVSQRFSQRLAIEVYNALNVS